MVEGESSIGRSPERKPEQPREEFTDLFEGFCQLGIDKETEELQYGPNTPQDETVLGTAIRLNKGEIDLEDEEQREELKEFLDEKEKEYRQRPEELLKIRKLRWVVSEGKDFLENDLRDEINRVMAASDGEELGKAMDEASSAFRETQGKPNPYETEADKTEKKTEDTEDKTKALEQKEREQTLGEFYVPQPGSENFLSDPTLRDIARSVDAGETTPTEALKDIEGLDEISLQERRKLRRELQGMIDKFVDKKLEEKFAFKAEEELVKDFREKLRSLTQTKKDEEGNILKEAPVANTELKKRINNLLEPWVLSNIDLLRQNLRELNSDHAIYELPEKGRKLLCAAIEKQISKVRQKERSSFAQKLPEEMPAAFRTGFYRTEIKNGQIPEEEYMILNVRKPQQRMQWLLENTSRLLEKGVFISESHKKWKAVLDIYRKEFGTAWLNSRDEEGKKGFTSQEEFKEFDDKIRSFMAVVAAARAVEHSNGSTERYLSVLFPGERGLDMDKKDDWSHLILPGHQERLVTLLDTPLVERYYRRGLKDAGIAMGDITAWYYRGERIQMNEKGEVNFNLFNYDLCPEFVDDEGNLQKDKVLEDMKREREKRQGASRMRKQIVPWLGVADRSAFLEKRRGQSMVKQGNIVDFLQNREGFKDYAAEVLVEEIDASDLGDFETSQLLGAARVACDAFLVEKYTQWEFYANSENDFWKPDPSFGGDPHRAALEPKYLTHSIKGMYQIKEMYHFENESEEDKKRAVEEVLKMVDLTFCPYDVVYAYPTSLTTLEISRTILKDVVNQDHVDYSKMSWPDRKKIAKEVFARNRSTLIEGIERDGLTDIVAGQSLPSSENESQKLLSPSLEDEASKRLISLIASRLPSIGGLTEEQLILETSKIGDVDAITSSQADFEILIKEALKKEVRVSSAEPLPPNCLADGKRDNRLLNKGLWTFLGGSRGPKIPMWTEEIMERDLPDIVENIDQAFGSDKDLVGLMIARLILTKSLAAVLERSDPELIDKMSYIFDPTEPRVKPYYQLEKFLWGTRRDGRDGYLAKLMGPRTNIPIGGNKYGAQEVLQRAQRVISYADKIGDRWNQAGYIMDALTAAGRNIR